MANVRMSGLALLGLLSALCITTATECPPYPAPVDGLTFHLLGQGHCTNKEGLTPRAYVCNNTVGDQDTATTINDDNLNNIATLGRKTVALEDAGVCSTSLDMDACAVLCLMDDGCTGFELQMTPPPNGTGVGTGTVLVF